MKTFRQYLAEQLNQQMVCPNCRNPMAAGTNFCIRCNMEVTPRPRKGGDWAPDEDWANNVPWDGEKTKKGTFNTNLPNRQPPKRFPPRQ